MQPSSLYKYFCAEFWVIWSVSLQTGKVVTSASVSSGGKFALKIQKLVTCVENVEANYLLIASGSSRQVAIAVWFLCLNVLRWAWSLKLVTFIKGLSLAAQLGHSLIDPVPSLFTFKIEDPQLTELSGVSFNSLSRPSDHFLTLPCLLEIDFLSAEKHLFFSLNT